MIKPFNTNELLARVEAVLRRSMKEDIITKQPYFENGYLKCDFNTRKFAVTGKGINLT